MDETVSEVLYETRHHATRDFPSDFSKEQVDGGVKGGLFSLLSFRGIYQLKEKWDKYKRPRVLKRCISLFISPSGERVAVTSGNQITILQKDDCYMEPCGIFTSSDRLTLFTHGAWSDTYDILGVIDDMDTLYFIKSNGEEITRVTKRQLKTSAPIIGLIMQDDPNAERSCFFSILTSDGLLYHIEFGQPLSPLISTMLVSSTRLALKQQFHQNVACLDFYPKLSLLVLVGSAGGASENTNDNSGFYCLSLWRIKGNSNLELLFCSPHFEGLFYTPKNYVGPSVSAKVCVSPQGKYVAALDLTGTLDILKLDDERCSLSSIAFGERSCSQMSDNLLPERRRNLKDILDFTWWSDCTLILANRSGVVTMLDVHSGTKLLQNDLILSMPILERCQQCQGFVFLLENTSYEDRHSIVSSVHGENITHGNYNQLHSGRLYWHLISFLERSVPEMYTILISNQRYRDALNLSNRHGLDRDGVFKSQWLHSDKETDDIKMFLSNIKDQNFVLAECIDRVGPSEDAVKALLSCGLRITDQYKFSESEDDHSSPVWDFRMIRLQLLQCRDRLETFVGINMGRFSEQEYSKFRIVPLNEAAVSLAESGKIGALNLLFKRHPYSLAPFILDILAAIPETVPVQTYGQLLPGRSPPNTIALRDRDWVECENMLACINRSLKNYKGGIEVKTELILKQCVGFVWPSVADLSVWYQNRVRGIDSLTGQLDNCLSMVEFACRKGIVELQRFNEDISYLYQLIYSNGCDEDISFSMSLVVWEKLTNYEKFKMMLKGVKEDTVVGRLYEKAIPFMHNWCSTTESSSSENHVKADSYLVRWLKEIASENKLDICLMVIEEGCKDFKIDGIFQDEVEAIELTLQCLYLCTLTDRWNTMASILSKLPRLGLRGKSSISDRDLSSGHVIQGSGSPRFPDGNDQVASSDRRVNLANPIKGISASGNAGGFVDLTNTVTSVESLEKRIKLAEGHVEAGRLLAYYQVPKPMSFFPTAHSDEKGVKQLLRLILSKFGRRQPGRSDNDWANMWRDMQCLQEKAFPFLDIEYMLMEFCRGLLKAGKFSLARNYLKGTSNISLATEKAENLVIQAAREYFFSASSLASTEIWKAKECLNLFPNSKNVKAEADIIDALTIKLPNLGVTLLPMEFRQIRNPMEIINMVITSQTGAYLDIDELIKIAKILGLGSQDDIATVQEAVAREAAVNGDLQLAFDLCIVLAKKGHGAIWDLCAAIARGPALDNMNISSRKQLLGFALSHCDEESIGELLHAWKDLDMQSQCEKLISLTGTDPPKFSVQGSSIISHPAHHIEDIVTLRESSKMVEGNDDQEVHLKKIKNILSTVGKDFPLENGTTWDSLLKENRNFLSFAALQLPWLLELSGKAEYGKQMTPVGKQYVSVRTQALVTSLSWLARNDITPNDDLIASLAKSIMDAPVTEGEDILGCLFLLNLVDAFHGVEIIEEQLKTRVRYQDICSIMNIGMTYSSLHNSGIECMNPAQRRKLLLQKFQEKHASFSLDTKEKIDKAQSTFWREWKLKLEEQKRLTDQCRVLEQIIPGVEPARFLSGDFKYMESAIYSFIDSVKLEKKPILKEALKLADTYGLSRTEVLLRYLGSALVSEHWENDDIKAEILHYKEEILTCAARVINMISSTVYPVIDGHNKKRLAYIYNILSDCYMQSKGTEESMLGVQCDPGHTRTLNLSQFYKVLERECRRVSFIKNLNFKNIAKLGDLNFEYFNEEVYKHINDSTVEALAEMVRTLVGIYKDSGAEGLMSWQAICKHHVSSLLATIETETKTKLQVNSDNVRALIIELENNYDRCSRYISVMSETDIFDIMGRYLALSIPYNCVESIRGDSEWVDCLILLLDLWVRLADDIQEILFHGQSDEKAPIMFNPESLSKCLKVFRKLVIEDKVSAKQGWGTVSNYAKVVLTGGFTADISIFCRAMGFSGCQFIAIAEVFAEVVTPTPNSNVNPDRIQSLPFLYASMTDSILLELGRGSSDNRSNLHLLLSSLSKLEGNLEDLKSVRYAVWGRLNAFSDNMQLQNHIRVYAMELMQSVTGKNRRGLPIEILSDVQPWEGWDEPQCITSSDAADQSVPKQSDGSSRLTSTLVALKSTQLVAAISPATEITPEDLMTIDSAVSCFLRLSKARTTELHIDVLQGVLGEWEGLFTSGKDEEESREPSDAENNWSVDDWDKEWESFQEEPGEKEGKEDGSVPVHPLHLCWMEIVKKLVEASQLAGVLKLIDGSLSRAKGIMLSENEAKTLCQLLLGTDWFLALKISLLLPYEPIRFQCLSAVEAKLKDGSILGKASRDHELLTLILSSGILSTIANDSSYSAVFSYLCYLVGNLSRLFQETQLTLVKYRPKDGSKRSKNEFFLFGRLLFPCFVSELVKAKQHLLAGFIVSQFMHTPASFGLIDVAEATLRMYLDGQIHIQQHAEPGLEEMGPCESLVNTVSSLRSKLGILVQSALSTLSTNVK